MQRGEENSSVSSAIFARQHSAQRSRKGSENIAWAVHDLLQTVWRPVSVLLQNSMVYSVNGIGSESVSTNLRERTVYLKVFFSRLGQ